MKFNVMLLISFSFRMGYAAEHIQKAANKAFDVVEMVEKNADPEVWMEYNQRMAQNKRFDQLKAQAATLRGETEQKQGVDIAKPRHTLEREKAKKWSLCGCCCE